MRERYPLGDYVPGTGWLYRIPLWVKAAAVAAIGLATFYLQSWPASLGALALSMLIFLTAGLGLRRLLRLLRSPAPVLVPLFAFQCWQLGADRAVVIVGNIVLCLLAASLLTLTTPVAALLEGLTSAVTPLRRFGADPERFALTVAITLRSIPFLIGTFSTVRDAARARGLQRNLRARTTPVILSAVAYGQRTGEALAARGLGELPELESDEEATP